MKFTDFRTFSERYSKTLESVLAYLSNEMSANFRDLILGLKRLDFKNNFNSFKVSVEIPAGEEIAIPNQIKNGIPDQRLIIRGNEASLSVCDGDAEWTQSFVFLKNTHATDTALLTVIFLRSEP